MWIYAFHLWWQTIISYCVTSTLSCALWVVLKLAVVKYKHNIKRTGEEVGGCRNYGSKLPHNFQVNKKKDGETTCGLWYYFIPWNFFEAKEWLIQNILMNFLSWSSSCIVTCCQLHHRFLCWIHSGPKLDHVISCIDCIHWGVHQYVT